MTRFVWQDAQEENDGAELVWYALPSALGGDKWYTWKCGYWGVSRDWSGREARGYLLGELVKLHTCFLCFANAVLGRGPGCSQPFWFYRALKLSQNLQKPWRSLSSLEEFWVVYDFILKHWNPLEIYVVNFRNQMLSWQKLSLLNGWNFIFFNWSVIALHCCVFCTTVWLSYLYAYIVLPCEPPSHTTSPQNFK